MTRVNEPISYFQKQQSVTHDVSRRCLSIWRGADRNLTYL